MSELEKRLDKSRDNLIETIHKNCEYKKAGRICDMLRKYTEILHEHWFEVMENSVIHSEKT